MRISDVYKYILKADCEKVKEYLITIQEDTLKNREIIDNLLSYALLKRRTEVVCIIVKYGGDPTRHLQMNLYLAKEANSIKINHLLNKDKDCNDN